MLFGCIIILFLAPDSVDAQIVAPGEYRCWTPREIVNDPAVDSGEAAKLVSGFCKYQAKGINGRSAFSRLDEIPQRIIKRAAPNVVNYMEPRGSSSDYSITWWIEGGSPNEVHPANHVIGKQLQLADVRTPLTRVPSVEVRAMVFTLDETKEREIGLDIAANFASREPLNEGALNFNAGSGLLSIVGGVTDSLASAIQIGFSMSSDKSYAKEQLAITTLCPVGEYCQFEDSTENYFSGPTGIEKERLGIRYSMVPSLGVEDGEIKLESMQFYLGLKTDDPDAPVNGIRPINQQTYILEDGKLHVLGSEIREFDSRGTQLVGKDRETVHSRLILLISASLRDDRDIGKEAGTLDAEPVGRSFSREELAQLDGQAGLYGVLSSFEKVCFEDVINPLMGEEICGFHLTKMNPAFVDYWAEVRIDSKKRLRYPQDHIRLVKLGDFYKGKGYYQIPMLNTKKARNAMKLRIELAAGGSGTDLRRAFKSKKVPIGVKFEFAYTGGHRDPVDVRASSVEPIM